MRSAPRWNIAESAAFLTAAMKERFQNRQKKMYRKTNKCDDCALYSAREGKKIYQGEAQNSAGGMRLRRHCQKDEIGR
jgi:hypothetical protein